MVRTPYALLQFVGESQVGDTLFVSRVEGTVGVQPSGLKYVDAGPVFAGRGMRVEGQPLGIVDVFNGVVL